MATQLRSQVQSLGLEMQKDTGFSEKLVTYLYALEVQLLVESGLEGELNDVQEAYDIPDDKAAIIVEATCSRYVSQMLNFALRGAKRYNEKETILWVKKIMKYAVFISSPVDADGDMFKEEDKKRMIQLYQTEVETGEDAELLELVEMYGDMTDKFRELIHLTTDYVSPTNGIEVSQSDHMYHNNRHHIHHILHIYTNNAYIFDTGVDGDCTAAGPIAGRYVK
jgi:hypothetical protein